MNNMEGLKALIDFDLDDLAECREAMKTVAEQEDTERSIRVGELQEQFAHKLQEIERLFWNYLDDQDRLIQKLQECKNEIDLHNHNVNIAKTSGTSASILGGIITIGSLIAAPLTGGISLTSIAAGASLSGAGAVTNLGSDRALGKLIEANLKEVERLLSPEQTSTTSLQAALKEFDDWVNQTRESLSDSPDGDSIFQQAYWGGKMLYTIYRLSTRPAQIAEFTGFIAKYGANTIKIGEFAINADQYLQLKYIESIMDVNSWLGNSSKVLMNLSQISRTLMHISNVITVASLVWDGWTLFQHIQNLVNNTPNEASVNIQKIIDKLLKNILEIAEVVNLITSDSVFIKTGYFKSEFGTVLDVARDDKNKGAGLVMWEQHGGDNQLWIVRSNGLIQSKSNLLFLDIQWSNRDEGAPIHCWEKNKSDAQIWKFNKDGSIGTKLCSNVLDVKWGNRNPGAELHMWSKNGSEAQKWNFIEVKFEEP